MGNPAGYQVALDNQKVDYDRKKMDRLWPKVVLGRVVLVGP